MKWGLRNEKAVHGIILAAETDDQLLYAISITTNIQVKYSKLKLEVTNGTPEAGLQFKGLIFQGFRSNKNSLLPVPRPG